MNKKPKVSVQILSWNRKKYLEQTLKNLAKQTWKNLEIIVIDNASSDGSAEMVAQKFPKIKLIRLRKNLGIAAHNIGFKKAQGEYIVLVDNDMVLAKDFIAKIVEKFEQNSKLAAIDSEVRLYSSKKIDCLFGGPIHSEDGNRKIGFSAISFNGGACGLSKKALKKVGGFSEEYFIYYHEFDLASRLLAAGFDVRFFPDIKAYHKAIPSKIREKRGCYFVSRNMIWWEWQHNTLLGALKETFKALITYPARITLFKNKQKNYDWRGILAGIWAIPRILKKRQPLNKKVLKYLKNYPKIKNLKKDWIYEKNSPYLS